MLWCAGLLEVKLRPMAPLLLLAVFLFAQGGGIYAPVRARKPRLPKVDRGACPFEGCQFGTWTAQTAIPVYSTWKPQPSGNPVRTLQKGENITAVTGIHITYKPTRIQMTSAIPKYHLQAGDTVLLYMSQGEGFYTAWFNGYWFENFDGSGLALKDGSGCQKNCDAVLLDNGQTVWWVKIKTKEGQVGWVKDMNFDGMDALAQMLPRPIWTSGVLLLFL